MKYKLVRDVTPDECSWLERTFKKGEEVYYYKGCTYGCCKDDAYTIEDGVEPFFELPYDAVVRIANCT